MTAILISKIVQSNYKWWIPIFLTDFMARITRNTIQ